MDRSEEMSRRTVPKFTRYRIYEADGPLVNCIDAGPFGLGMSRTLAMQLAAALRRKHGGKIYVRGAKS